MHYFFFPNAQKALKNIKNSLKKSGTIGISVHGSKDNVPFFSSILDSAKNTYQIMFHLEHQI